MTDDDRALAFSRLFRDFRQRAVANPVDFARTFGSPQQRERYEEIWRIMIDGIRENLDELRTAANASILIVCKGSRQAKWGKRSLLLDNIRRST